MYIIKHRAKLSKRIVLLDHHSLGTLWINTSFFRLLLFLLYVNVQANPYTLVFDSARLEVDFFLIHNYSYKKGPHRSMMASLKSSFFREGEHFLLKCELNLILVMINFGEFQCYLDDIGIGNYLSKSFRLYQHRFKSTNFIGSLSYSHFFYIKWSWSLLY